MSKFKFGNATCLGGMLLLAACASTRTGKTPDSGDPARSSQIVVEAIPKLAKMECMADSGALDSLRHVVKDAMVSGDGDKMKSALQKADAHLTKMKEKMEKCKAGMAKAGTAEGGMKCCKKPADTDKAAAEPLQGHVH